MRLIEKYKDEKNILDIPKEDRILFIEEILINDPYFTDDKGHYGVIAEKANQLIESFFEYSKENPIMTEWGDRIFFEPNLKSLKEKSYVIAQAKYAVHFVTKSSHDDKKRYYERSKTLVLPFLLDALINPDEVLNQKDKHGSTIYVKEIKSKRYCCSVLRAEFNEDGSLRAITAYYTSKKKSIESKKASGFWSNAFYGSRIKKSPPDIATSGLSGDTDIPRAQQDKDTDNSESGNTKMMRGGKAENIENLIKNVERYGKIRWKYQVEETEYKGSGSAIMYDWDGKAYEIVTWNKGSIEHRPFSKTIAIETSPKKLTSVRKILNGINWLITGE